MSDDRERLEQLIGDVLREQPPRRAPAAMESRVMAAIEARGAPTFWKRGFVHWPAAAKVAFVAFALGMTKLTMVVGDWALAVVRPDAYVAGAVSKVSWIKVLAEVVYTGARSIPEHWLWMGLMAVAAVYGVLFGVSAVAYRALVSNR